MAYTLAPTPKFIALDSTGVTYPLAAVYTYAAGTLTPIDTYSDSSGSLNANPVVCDSAGRATIYLTAGLSYKFILKDTVGGSTVWTQDNIQATPAASVDLTIDGLAGEDIAAGQGVYLSDGSGGKVAGSWYLWDADQTYSSVTAGSLAMAQNAIAMSATGSLKLSGRITGLSGLAAGTQYYISATAGGLTSSAPANTRAVGVADSTTSLIFSPWVPATYATATVPGIVSLTTQTLGAGTKTVDAITVTGISTLTGQATAALPPIFYPGTSGVAGAAPSNVSGVVFSDSAVRVTSGTSEVDLSTTTLPANVLSANGKALRISMWGTRNAGAGAVKTIRCYFGGTVICSRVLGADDTTWMIDAIVQRTGAATETSRALYQAQNVAIGTVAIGAGTIVPGVGILITLAVNTAATIIVKSSGQTATAGETITQYGFIVEVVG